MKIKGNVRKGIIIPGDGNVINVNTDKQKKQDSSSDTAEAAIG